MRLKLKLDNQNYSFDVTMYRDDDNNRLCFTAEFSDYRIMLLEFSFRTGRWQQIGGDTFADNLQTASFARMDRASLITLLAEEQPLEKFTAMLSNWDGTITGTF